MDHDRPADTTQQRQVLDRVRIGHAVAKPPAHLLTEALCPSKLFNPKGVDRRRLTAESAIAYGTLCGAEGLGSNIAGQGTSDKIGCAGQERDWLAGLAVPF
jgi:hypothetical protein